MQIISINIYFPENLAVYSLSVKNRRNELFRELSNIWARLLSSCVKELDNKMVGNYSHCIEEASDRHAFSITIYLFILQRILTFALSLYKTILKSIGLVSATSFTFKDALFCSEVFCLIFTPGLIVYTTK